MGTAKELTARGGLLYIGRFDGTEQGNMKVTVTLPATAQYPESRDYTAQFEFRAFNSQTGEISPIGKAVEELVVGAACVVRLMAQAHQGGVSQRTGKRYEPFVTYVALDAAAL